MKNVYDLTRRSDNMAILKKGGSGYELSCETVQDKNLQDSDLPDIEIEVNKKKRKKQAQQSQMMSPAASVRSNSIQGGIW